MRGWIKASAGVIAVAVLLAAGAGGSVWWAGSRQLAMDHGALPETVAGGPGDAALGARLVKVYGCSGCHGDALIGKDFYGVSAPNLRRRAREWRREDFARAVRRGLRPDGTSVTWAMPSEHFSVLADNEIAGIHAHLRALPAAEDAVPITLKTRFFKAYKSVTGELVPNAAIVRDTDRGPEAAPAPGAPGWGQYFTRVACAECHNHGLGGIAGDTPALADVMQVYDWPAFQRLTIKGLTHDGREVRLMTGVGRERLVHMTGAERRALFDYLKSLPQP